MEFVSLHSHTTFSHGDGYRSPLIHAQRQKDLGYTAATVTEHRNVSSHVQHEQACKKVGLKPIYGCEFDVALPDEPHRRHFHQTVLAMDEEGYLNLNRLVTLAWKQTKYVPRLYTPQMLDPKLTKGLIVLSGCADSQLACTVLGGKGFGDRRPDWEQEDAVAGRELVERFQEVYGDRYYLEVQQFPQLERSTILNQLFMDISAATGVEAVVTADVHYPYPTDNDMQRVLHAAHRGGTVETVDANWEYDILLTYPETDQQVLDNLAQQELSDEEATAALKASQEIAKRCNVELPKSDPIRYLCERVSSENSPAPDQKMSELDKDALASQTLREWIERGIDYRIERTPNFAQRWDSDEQGYLDRIHYEFGLIEPKGFCDYFLVTADLVQWAKDVDRQGVGPGRGSAAGSLICYLLRITEIDPMMFPLMQFERFIDPSRPDQPDIDIDFAHPERAFAYAAEKYGADHVAHVGNFQRYRGKGALKDVGKAYSETIPFDVIVKLGKMIVDRQEGDARENNTVEDTFDSFPDAKELLEQYPDLWKATRLEGDYRTLSVHAAGMVISSRPITKTCAIYEKTNSEGEIVQVIPYDKRDAELLDMLKLDILGLSTMAIIEDVVEMVPGLDWDQVYGMSYDDPTVLEHFARADLTGIFQFEGRTTKSIVEQIYTAWTDPLNEAGPVNDVRFMTLADINALSRPGSLISGMTARYIDVELLQRERAVYHPVVDKILAETNGCLVYQEQVMSIGREIGGFPGAKVGALRRIIGKKKGGDAFEEFFEEFKEGAARLHNMSEFQARQLWDWMAVSSSYLFNIPHAVSYAVIAYWAMWIKVHHPVEFYASALRYAKKQKDKDPALSLMQDAVRHGVDVRPPRLDLSGVTWERDGQLAIRAGFSQFPGIGEKTAEAMVDWRDQEWGIREVHGMGAEPMTWDDMRYRKGKTGRKTKPDEPDQGLSGMGPTTIQKIKDFLSQDDPFGIYLATNSVDKVTQAILDGKLPLGAPTANSSELPNIQDQRATFVGLIKECRIIDVIDAERKRNPSKTVEQIKAELTDPHLSTKAKLICVDHVGVDVHVNISRYKYPEHKADLAEIDPKVDVAYCVGVAREGFGPTLQADKVIVIDPNGA